MQKKILACVDNGEFCLDICEYAIEIASNLGLPLVFLNVVESNKSIKKLDLSGNIGLGARDDLQESLVSEDSLKSQERIKRGKEALKKCQEFAQNKGFLDFETLQIHSILDEYLEELSANLKLTIIGLRSRGNEPIGAHVEDILRTLNIPILLINSKFRPINSILMAYDGSEFAKHSLKTAANEPIFPNTKRYIANVSSSEQSLLLDEAKQILGDKFEVSTHALNGDKTEALLSFQEAQNIDIIAMGAYSHNRLKSIIFGSFTTKMLQKAKRPLLMFR